MIEAFRSVRFSQTLKYPGVFKCMPPTLRSAGAMRIVSFRATSSHATQSFMLAAAAAVAANAHLEKETLAALAQEIPAPGQPEVFG